MTTRPLQSSRLARSSERNETMDLLRGAGWARLYGRGADVRCGCCGALDAGTPDTGAPSRPPDAGFGGGLGARCQRDTDCDNPSTSASSATIPIRTCAAPRRACAWSRGLITPRAPVSRTKRSPVRSPPTVRRHGSGACRYLLLLPTPDLAQMGASRLMGAEKATQVPSPTRAPVKRLVLAAIATSNAGISAVYAGSRATRSAPHRA